MPYQKLNKTQKEMLSVLVFLIKMIFLSLPIYFILFYNVSLYPLQETVIQQSIGILDFFSYNPVREGFMITVNSSHYFSFLISEDCTPWKTIWLIISLMIAVPKIRISRRLIGMAIGASILWVGNIFRIIFIVWVEQNISFSLAMLIHDYLWKTMLILTVIAIWLSWLSWNNKLRKVNFRKVF